MLDKAPDLFPVAVRKFLVKSAELCVDLLEQFALFCPAFDDIHLSLFDDFLSGLFPAIVGISHAFAIVVPHNSLFDDVSNSRNNAGMNIETILPE